MKTEILDHVIKQKSFLRLGRQYRSLAREAEERNLNYEEYLLGLFEAKLQA